MVVGRFSRKLSRGQRKQKKRLAGSHPHANDATAENIAEKNCEKFNVLNFSRQNTSLVGRLYEGGCICDFTTRWQRDIFEKSHHHRKQKLARVARFRVSKKTSITRKHFWYT